jgi:hypothetical protein
METKVVLERDMNLREIGKHMRKITDIITGKDRVLRTFIMNTTLLGRMVTENQTTLNDLKMVTIMLGGDLGREVKLTQDEVVEPSLDTN